VFPETQYGYEVLPEVVIVFPEVEYEPLGAGVMATRPIEPASWTVPEQLHPPLAAFAQVTDE
jgi:hypothetical protein